MKKSHQATSITSLIRLLCCWLTLFWTGVALAQNEPAVVEAPAAESATEEEPTRRSTSGEVSVRPGINENYLSPNLNPERWIDRFEVESREVFAARNEILKELPLERGMHIADVGAGTGVYSALLANATGSDGWVYAVDIAPKFIEHISNRAREEGIVNLSTVLCQEDSVALPPRSIDLAYTCDVYHHFEFPQSTLRSILRALKPGGHFVVVDFERIPGKSTEWTLNHVRAGKEVVRQEIEQAGFVFVREPQIKGFLRNYMMVFRAE